MLLLVVYLVCPASYQCETANLTHVRLTITFDALALCRYHRCLRASLVTQRKPVAMPAACDLAVPGKRGRGRMQIVTCDMARSSLVTDGAGGTLARSLLPVNVQLSAAPARMRQGGRA